MMPGNEQSLKRAYAVVCGQSPQTASEANSRRDAFQLHRRTATEPSTPKCEPSIFPRSGLWLPTITRTPDFDFTEKGNPEVLILTGSGLGKPLSMKHVTA
ncbi:hypothetical protein CPLU01_09107 [Colletotrichum plurivorum]|uniref:Uncharacterized protein n=1 Tax=Colletotrichum plurivorum TaxID=2175906 RepID=A0A8H6NCC9_9PEZI|nr:hypothetical protein CPLU01_09107 [Colletotrichum plurivorum]